MAAVQRAARRPPKEELARENGFREKILERRRKIASFKSLSSRCMKKKLNFETSNSQGLKLYSEIYFLNFFPADLKF